MSLKRSSAGGRGAMSGSTDSGTKVDKQEFFDELKRLAGTNQVFTPVDIALSMGAGEPQISRALLGLAVEGVLEKVEAGKYRSTPMTEMPIAEFVKALTRASKMDSTRQRDISEIERLKKNNDIMRGRLLQAQAERDHYMAALKKHGIDAGPPPAPPAPSVTAETPAVTASSDGADIEGGESAITNGGSSPG